MIAAATLVLADLTGLIFTVVIILIVFAINAIKEVSERSKREQRARERQAEQQRRQSSGAPTQAPRPAEPQKKPVQDEIDQFLEDLARRSGLPVPPRQAPPRPKPQAPPAPAPDQRRPPVTRPTPPRPESKPVQPLPASKPGRYEPATSKPHLVVATEKPRLVVSTEKPHLAPHIVPLATADLRVAAAQMEIESDSSRSDEAAIDIKTDVASLRQAIVLRELLGPCRARQPYRMK